MIAPLEEYQRFIDDMVRIRPGVDVRWLKEGRRWPDFPENQGINDLIADLRPEQKDVLGRMLQDARDGGIHDVLAYLSDEINLAGLGLTRNGQQLPVEPYGTEMYFDWVARRDGQPWPKAAK